VVALALALAAGVVPWLAWLALSDMAGYIQAGQQHLSGHFTRYGESIWTDPHPMLRPWVALRTLAVYGLGLGGPNLGWARVFATAGWIVTLVMATRLRPWRGPVAWLIALWAIPHLGYVFLAHDVAYGRYALSATLVVALLAGLAGAVTKPKAMALGVPLLTAASVAAVTVPIAVHQARQPPVEYQAARYLARQPGQAVVLVSGADFLFALYAAQFEDRVSLVRAPIQDVALLRGRATAEGVNVYRTALPPTDSASWRPVAHFCRDRMIEPLIASELWLFRAGTAEPDRPLPACGEER
jgi:hypothetical protein